MSPRVSRKGVVFAFVLLLAMISVFSLQYVAPKTWIGQLMSTRLGRLVAMCAFVGIAVLGERWLYRRGIRTLEPPNGHR